MVKAYLWVSFIMGVIYVVGKFYLVLLSTYPRQISFIVQDDVFFMVCRLSFTLWAAYLLFG